MATTTHSKIRPTTGVEVDVCVGRTELPVGKLIYVKDGAREFSQFAYREAWLISPQAFDISPDLIRTLGYQLRKPPTKDDSAFFFAMADTEPDAWGRCGLDRARLPLCRRRFQPRRCAPTP